MRKSLLDKCRLTTALFMVLNLVSGDVVVNETKRYWYGDGENQGYCLYCKKSNTLLAKYYVPQCYDQNKNRLDKEERVNEWFPYCHTVGSIPACPALPAVLNGTWTCEAGVDPSVAVPVYKSCQLSCTEGLELRGDDRFYCTERRQWTGNYSEIRCIPFKTESSAETKEAENTPIVMLIVILVVAFVIILICGVVLVVCVVKKLNKPRNEKTQDIEKGREGSTSSDSGLELTVSEKTKLSDSDKSIQDEESRSVAEPLIRKMENSPQETSFTSEQSSRRDAIENDDNTPVRGTDSLEESTEESKLLTENDDNTPVRGTNSLEEYTKESKLLTEIVNPEKYSCKGLQSPCPDKDSKKPETQLPKTECQNKCGAQVALKGHPKNCNLRPDEDNCYNIPEGDPVYIAARGSAGSEVKHFHIFSKKFGANAFPGRLTEIYSFLYVLPQISREDSGLYEYQVTLACGHEEKGTLNINVIDHERPETYGQENETADGQLTSVLASKKVASTSALNDEIEETAITSEFEEAGSTDTEKIEATPGSINTQHQPRAPEELPDMCSLSIQELEEMEYGCNLIEKLGHHLDPVNKPHCWKSLGRKVLRIDEAHLDCIEWHKHGRINDGPTKFILEEMKHKGLKVGHLTMFFSQPQTSRHEVVIAVSKYHTSCDFCQLFYNCVKKDGSRSSGDR